MEAQCRTCLKRATCENEELGPGLFFLFHSNLGSGRSPQGQGLAQCDPAQSGSLLGLVIPRDSILSRIHSPDFAAIEPGLWERAPGRGEVETLVRRGQGQAT